MIAGTEVSCQEFRTSRRIFVVVQFTQQYISIAEDIIKIGQLLDLDFEVLGYLDPGITVNIIQNGERVKRERLSLPEKVTGIIKCKNPRCITSTEQELVHEFKLVDAEKKIYRCIYCESEAAR